MVNALPIKPKSKQATLTVRLLRYFVNKWASIVLGMGTFFVIIGLILDLFQTFNWGNYMSATGKYTWVGGLSDNSALIFSCFFYGGLLAATGISTLLLLHMNAKPFTKLRNRIIFLSALLFLVFFLLPVPGAQTIYPPGTYYACSGPTSYCSLQSQPVYGSTSYWMTGYGGVSNTSNSYPYFDGYFIGFG